jgi:hypothetical protein
MSSLISNDPAGDGVMSSFLSTKYLKYRGRLPQAPQPIDRDLHCASCGYNLRGLMTGRNCPECGQIISLTRSLDDPLLSGTLDERRKVQLGLTLIAFCAIAVAACRIGFPVAWSLAWGRQPMWHYIVFGLAMSVMWAAGAWLITPPRLGPSHARLRPVRRLIRATQPLIVVAYLCWLLVEARYAGTTAGDRLTGCALLVSVPAAAGMLLVGVWLVVLAEDAGLDAAAGAINLSLWVVPILSAIVIFIPLQLPFFALAFMMIVLLAWAWYMVKFARGAWEMQQHVTWAIRLSADGYGRPHRVAQTRAELDEQAAAIVRPLPPRGPEGDVPISRLTIDD